MNGNSVTTARAGAAVNGQSAPMSALDSLLGDFDRADFFANHWEKRTCVIHHGDPQRFAHLLSCEQFMDEEVRHCRVLRGAYLDPQGWPSEVVIRPGQAKKVFESGMTVAASMMRESGALKAFLDSFRACLFGVAPHFNAYYSPDRKGYSVHFDAHPVWFLQVAGSKHWYLGRKPVVRNPPMTLGFPPDREVLKLPWITVNKPPLDDPEQFMSVTLEPGDVAYMPPGTWHRASARGYSLALTLASAHITVADLVCGVMQDRLSSSECSALTERVGGVAASARGGNGALPGGVEQALAGRLAAAKDLVSRIEMEDLRRKFAQLAKMSTEDLIALNVKKAD
ncbi:MAG: cupin-like domain-containing protein [Gammaproteobacteria bacterium]|nr:cupin-like domain-containing protein [Gammaproteobacteria bacterium]